MRRRWLATGLLFCAIVGGLVAARFHYPGLEAYEAATLTSATRGHLGLTYAGTSTVLIDDGETALLIDGFFTRPSLFSLSHGPIAPDAAAIRAGLARLPKVPIGAVIVTHSHHDHVMDAPTVAQLTGARVLGSPTTLNLGRGQGLPESQLVDASQGQVLSVGAFRVHLIRSQHTPLGPVMGWLTGHGKTQDQALPPPMLVTDYVEGGTYAVLIEHPQGNLLVNGSTGWAKGMLQGRHADVALLSTANLGRQTASYAHDYVQENVGATGAKLVIPLHWDDFFLPGDQALKPLPWLLDDFLLGQQRLQHESEALGARYATLPPWQRVGLFVH